MSVLAYLIILFFVGLFVGALASLLVPGPDPMGLGLTALIGLFGTFIAGLFSWYVLGRHGPGSSWRCCSRCCLCGASVSCARPAAAAGLWVRAPGAEPAPLAGVR